MKIFVILPLHKSSVCDILFFAKVYCVQCYAVHFENGFIYNKKSIQLWRNSWRERERARETRTGFPSIDKPWLKYYSEEALNTPLPECTIYEYLWECNKDHLDDIALVYFGVRLTYKELFAKIEHTASVFSELGIQAGDIVVVAAVTIPEIIYSIYALNLIGAISNFVDPRTSVDGIRSYIKESEAKFSITLEPLCNKILQATIGTNIKKVITISPADSLPVPKRFFFKANTLLKKGTLKHNQTVLKWAAIMRIHVTGKAIPQPYRKENCCVIVHAGGTTGLPKGVMLSDDNLNAMVLNAKASEGGYEPGNRFLNIMPPFIAYGLVNGIHMILSCGMENVLIPQFDPNEFDKLILKYKPTHILGVPTHYSQLFKSKLLQNADLSFLRIAGVGGDQLSEDTERQIESYLHKHCASIPVATGYGMTEVSAAACGYHRNAHRLGSVGIPFLNTTVRIVNPETLVELSYGEQGEILISSPAAMLQYDNNPLETARTLISLPSGGQWVRSGDIGHIDEDGFLYIDGRIKRIIIRHDGFKVFPPQIESVISAHPAVFACCAVGRADSVYSQGREPVAFVVLQDSFAKKGIIPELYDLCKKHLPEYAQPVDIRVLDSIPHTAIGKLDYTALKRLAARHE